MYLVQSVLFDKSKFSLHLSKEWLKHHHYHHANVDNKPNTYRFRQVSPTEAKKKGYTNFKTKKLGNSGVSLVLAYNEGKSGAGLYNDELHHFLFNSYSNGKDYKDWKLDHSLSDNQVQVYFNPNTGKAVVVHRGSQDLQDWYENTKQFLGFKSGTKLDHSRKIQKEAEAKYGAKNVITIGHSKGAYHAEEVGKNSGEIITLNKPVTTWDVIYGKKVPEHQTDIKAEFDPVSFLRHFQPGKDYELIKSDTYNPLTEHNTDVLDRVKDEKYWGKGRCWNGYKPVPGRKPYSKGSCRKTGGAINSVSQWEEEVNEFLNILEFRLASGEATALFHSLEELDDYIGGHPNEIDMVLLHKYILLLKKIIEKEPSNQLVSKAEELLSGYGFLTGGKPCYDNDAVIPHDREEDIEMLDNPINIVPREVWYYKKWEEEFKKLKLKWEEIFNDYYNAETRDDEEKVDELLKSFFNLADDLKDNLSHMGFKGRLLEYLKSLKKNNIILKSHHYSRGIAELIREVEKYQWKKGGGLKGAGSGIITNQWNKTENELKEILVNISHRPLTSTIPYREKRSIVILFNKLTELVRKIREPYNNITIPLSIQHEIIGKHRIILHLYNDYIRDNPRFTDRQHESFQRILDIINDYETEPHHLTPRGNEEPPDTQPSGSGRGREMCLSCD